MFGQFKEFQPPSGGSSYFKGLSYGGMPLNIPKGVGYSGISDSARDHDDQISMSDRMAASPYSKEMNWRTNDISDMHTSTSGSARLPARDAKLDLPKKSQEIVGQFRSGFAPSNDYTKAIAELTGALKDAMNDKSVLISENGALKEKVAAYEVKLDQVDKMFNTMMARISALEKPSPVVGSISKMVTISKQSSPRSPMSARSTPRSMSASQPGSRSGSLLKQRVSDKSVVGASRGRVGRNVSAVNRQAQNGRDTSVDSRHERRGRDVSVEKRQPLVTPRSARKLDTSVVRPGATEYTSAHHGASQRRSSVESVSSVRTPARPVSPSIRYEVHVALHDQLLAKAQLTSTLSPDGPFLYIVQCELKPHICISAKEMQGFEGLSIAVMATNTRTRQDNVIFKSHSSHIENPPVNEQDGYFSHSCWLSGPEASVVGSVRMFFRHESDPLTGPVVSLYGMSLKYWFPESSENTAEPAPAFTKPHWKQLLKLLGIL